MNKLCTYQQCAKVHVFSHTAKHFTLFLSFFVSKGSRIMLGNMRNLDKKALLLQLLLPLVYGIQQRI